MRIVRLPLAGVVQVSSRFIRIPRVRGINIRHVTRVLQQTSVQKVE